MDELLNAIDGVAAEPVEVGSRQLREIVSPVLPEAVAVTVIEIEHGPQAEGGATG